MQTTPVKSKAAALAKFSLRLLGWLFLLLPTLALTAALPTVSRVKDINTTLNGSGSNPQEIVKVGNLTFFTAYTPTTGTELWKTDGTSVGTVLVKDIYAGIDSYMRNLTAVGNMLYFSADNGVNGEELWRSDGTAAGTLMVKDILPGNGWSSPSNLTAIVNMLYFTADDGVNGEELWRSDGTAAGTVMVRDINAGSDSSWPSNLTAVGNVLYFGAKNNVNSSGLWKSDGTAVGTVMVENIYPNNLTAVGSTLYFGADNGINGSELWCSDGTAAGTVLVKDINAGISNSYPDYLTAVGSTLYFIADDGVHDRELWKSDGTTAGTLLVKDITRMVLVKKAPPRPTDDPLYLTAVGSMLYFTVNDGIHGRELWKSDGTAVGTVLVKDINAGSSSAWGYDHYDPNLTALGTVLYFRAYDNVTGNELWRSDSSAAGTVMVKDINAGISGSVPYNLTTVGNVLYFGADNGVTGNELWRSDGTAAGTVLVKDIDAVSDSSYPYNLTTVGNVLYFGADNGVTGYELWRSDGTAAGTVLVKDIYAGSNSPFCYFNGPYYRVVPDDIYDTIKNSELSNENSAVVNNFIGCIFPNFTAVDDMLYFVANNGVNGYELWSSDGTAAGTVMVKDINDGSGSSFCENYGCNPDNFTAVDVDNVLYFSAYDGVNGRELWRSDGTAAGTFMVKDINTGSNSSWPNDLTTVGNVLYFSAYDGVNGRQLWRSDGTAAGTIMIKDVNVVRDGRFESTAVGNLLFFTGYDEINGYELWCSDGTAAGTVMVKDIRAGSDSALGDGYPNFTAVGNVLYFRANDGVNGKELWRSDGTAAGTVLVKDIYAGNGSAWGDYDYPYFTAVGTMLYFSANNGINGSELWHSDGTAAGTTMVKDINAGSGSSFCENYGCFDSNFTEVDNVLYFNANDGIHGEELWQSDGTEAGTQMIELVPGSGGSAPYDLIAVGNRLYFTAVDETAGRELWRADIANIPNFYTVTPSASFGGTVTPSQPQQVAFGNTLSFTVTAFPRFTSNKYVSGTCPSGNWKGNVWTTGAITADCTVNFSFKFYWIDWWTIWQK